MADVAEALGQEECRQLEDSQRDLFLTFRLHDEDYGVAINYVTEIIGIQKITRVPDLPDEIKGVINLRGRVIPVMDVRVKFGLSTRNYDERTCVIVVEVDDITTGLVVDRVKEVVEISAGQIEPPPCHNGEQSYVLGMGKVGNEIKILLDVESLVGANVEICRETVAEQNSVFLSGTCPPPPDMC